MRHAFRCSSLMAALGALALAGCGGGSSDSSQPAGGTTPTPTPGSGATVYAPAPVAKSPGKKISVHVMPWFETPASAGAWGIHWTMANRNPEVVDGSGKRQIASYYYPLIGPYASADKDVIEYQLLLMKYAGIDGVIIDWPGTLANADYPRNRANAEALIALTERVGLEFAVCYEDNNLNLAGVADKVAQVKADVTYAQSTYFNKANYTRISGAPLLLVFGPQALQAPSDWASAFSDLSPKPTFLTLWYESQEAGASAQGEFAWIYSDFLTGLRRFYDSRPLAQKAGVAYPGFNSYYAAGGWGRSPFKIDVGPATFGQTLSLAKTSDATLIQIATWNDYGEGTMIEPTREFGYGYLEALQSSLGVGYGRGELELVATLYQLRKQHAGDAALQSRLDQAFYYLVSLQVANARSLLSATTAAGPAAE